MCISDYIQTAFLGRFLKKLVDEQCSSVRLWSHRSIRYTIWAPPQTRFRPFLAISLKCRLWQRPNRIAYCKYHILLCDHSLTTGIISTIKHNVNTTFYPGVYWPEIGRLMEESIMFDICTNCFLSPWLEKQKGDFVISQMSGVSVGVGVKFWASNVHTK